MRYFLISSYLFFISVCVASKPDSLLKLYTSTTDKDRKAEIIQQMASLPCDWHKLIREVSSDNDPALMMKALSLYFDDLENETSTTKPLVRANEMVALAKANNNDEWYYLAYSALSKTYLLLEQPQKAEEFVIRAFYHVSLLENDILKAKCMIQYGDCQELSNKKIDAFRNYINALVLGEKNNDQQLIYECYNHLSRFYFDINNHTQAKEFKLKQIEMLSAVQSLDSVKLVNLYIDLASILYHKNEVVEADKMIQKVMAFAKRHDMPDLSNAAIVARSTYFVNHSLMAELAEMFTKDYPGELANIKESSFIMYSWLQAYIQEVLKRNDSSYYYYHMVQSKFAESPDANNLVLQSNFFKRFGQFLLRQNDLNGAINKMELSYEAAKKAGYLPYMIETSRYLDSLYFSRGDVTNAYHFSRLNNDYTLQQASVNKEEDILLLKIDAETKQAELRKARMEEQTARRYNLQYMGIILLITFSFISLGTMGRFKMPRWTIQSVGFVSFIFLFEFIVLLADNKIHHMTHGEPWMVMAMKSVLIGILFPLHHWLESKALHFLTSDRTLLHVSAQPLREIAENSEGKRKKRSGRKPAAEVQPQVNEEGTALH